MTTGSALKCPRCSASIAAAPDEIGVVVCPQCGSKLRSRSPVVVKVQGATAPAPHAPGPPADIDTMLARLEAAPNPTATLPPGTPLRKIPRPEELAAAKSVAAPVPPILETLLAEVRELRHVQEEILELLRTRETDAPAEPVDDGDPFSEIDEPLPVVPTPVRTRRRKTVLLIDDDPASREAAVQALERAEVPVTTAVEGGDGLAAIAHEKPDVVILELGLRGAMAGKDVINMIKATMEWIDIPIVLYTRLPVASQKEARQQHGADEVVPKDAGPDALVAKVIAVFRRG